MTQIMSEQAETEGEFYTQAKEMLQRLGVRDVKVGESGSIPIRNRNRTTVEDFRLYETTRAGQRALNQFPKAPGERILNQGYDRPICGIVGCGVTQFLGIECSATSKQYKDPEIELRNNPTSIRSATAYLNPVNARIEGEVEISGENFSQPGEVRTKTTYKCKDDVETETEVVDESAIVSMNATHDVGIDAISEGLDTVQSTIDSVSPEQSKSATVSFRKEGVLEVIESIIDIWVSGSMVANVVGEVDVQYEWKGSTKNRTFDIEADVRIPIQNLEYSW